MKPGDILRNTFKERLARGEVVSSMTVRLVRGIEIARIARTAGFDALYVDLEHSSLTLDATGQICMAGLEMGLPAFVRVPANTPEYISRVLDAGALGIVAPDVRSAEEARAVVAAAKYAPLGSRGAGGQLPHLQYRSFPAAEANAAVNAATTVIVQFESWAAVEKAEEIMGVEGVDIVLIGTNDSARRPRPARPVRARQGARGLRARHCRGGQARQARRRRRACLAPAADRRVREVGRPLRLDRHRHRLPAGGGDRAGQAGARPRHVTSSRAGDALAARRARHGPMHLNDVSGSRPSSG